MNSNYGIFIIPISIIVHLTIINVTLYTFTHATYWHLDSILYYNLVWLLTTLELDYYPTRRHEKFFTNIRKVFHLYLIFGLFYFALFAFKDFGVFSIKHQFMVYMTICSLLLLYRIIFYWARSTYRMGGGNYVRVVAVGCDPNLNKIRRVFDDPNLGYRYKGYFDDHVAKDPEFLGKVADCFLYILENSIDEIYCLASKFSKKELQNLINFADNNLIKFKIIPDNKDIFTRAMTIEMYDKIPVLNLRKVPLDTIYAKFAKRLFDLFFSSLVIVFILSWLTHILYVLIKT